MRTSVTNRYQHRRFTAEIISHTGGIAISTTGRKILTSPHGNENAGCNGSSRQGMPSVSAPRMVPLPNISNRDAVYSPPPSTAKKWSTDFRPGER
jgi:hypothetical protein